VRVKALQKFDEFIYWSLGARLKPYIFMGSQQQIVLQGDIPSLPDFEEEYGYFSFVHPIVAKVTPGEEDLRLACCLLKSLYQKGLNGPYLDFAILEILTKVIAYRDLKKGQEIQIPVSTGRKLSYETFTVDRIFNIWRGMPAFGLLPKKPGLESILLFRGTDLSLFSQRGWASMLSDLDINGPGLKAFERAREQLRGWLQKAMAERKPARAMGFSLGGALASYLYIFENSWLSPVGSAALSSPGVSEKVVKSWRALAPERKKGLISYVTAGDVIPRVGNMFGTVYCLTPPTTLRPLRAHTILLSSFSSYTQDQIDVSRVDSEQTAFLEHLDKNLSEDPIDENLSLNEPKP
jgi:hypothetical protein